MERQMICSRFLALADFYHYILNLAQRRTVRFILNYLEFTTAHFSRVTCRGQGIYDYCSPVTVFIHRRLLIIVFACTNNRSKIDRR